MLRRSYEKKMNFWHEIEANVSVIYIIDIGYKIPFAITPSTKFFENNRSATEKSEFVSDTIDCLLNTGRIVETDALPYVLNPLSVSKNNNDKPRLILDLRYFYAK